MAFEEDLTSPAVNPTPIAVPTTAAAVTTATNSGFVDGLSNSEMYSLFGVDSSLMSSPTGLTGLGGVAVVWGGSGGGNWDLLAAFALLANELVKIPLIRPLEKKRRFVDSEVLTKDLALLVALFDVVTGLSGLELERWGVEELRKGMRLSERRR